MLKRLYVIFLFVFSCFIFFSEALAIEQVPKISLYNLTDKPITYFFTNRNRDTISGIVEPSESQSTTLNMIPPDNFLPTSTAIIVIVNQKGSQILKYHFAFTHNDSFYLSKVMYIDPHYEALRDIPSHMIMKLFIKSKNMEN